MRLAELKRAFANGTLDKARFIEHMYAHHAALYDYAAMLGETDIASITIAGQEVRFETRDGIRFVTDIPDKRIAPIEILNFNQYEPEITRLLDQLVRPGMTVLDIGANIGWYALRMATHVANVTIHAFEPLPPIHAMLTRNIAANSASAISAHAFGFSRESGQFAFHYSPAYSSQSSLKDLGNIDTQEVMCELRKLDDWAEAQGVAPDLIKCDVEGAELLVFEGGQQTLARHRPIIITEMLRKWAARFDYHPNDIIALLGTLGYDVFAIGEEKMQPIRHVTEETIETNYLFLHKEKHATVYDTLF